MNQFRALSSRLLADLKRRRQLLRLGRGKGDDYRVYLRTQIDRTLAQTKRHPELTSSGLLDALLGTGRIPSNASILCVGSRTPAELDYFRAKGYPRVVGIDLVSQTPDILVMDMHEMKFPDSQYDVVYSSHSLEHAYDVAKVTSEIVRVARPGALVAVEVPIRYETRGADLKDFGSAQGVLEAFSPHVGRVLVSEDHPARSTANAHGTAVARAIFVVSK